MHIYLKFLLNSHIYILTIKKLLPIILFLSFSNSLFPQGGWFQLDPIDPYERNVWDVHFFSPDTGWVLSETIRNNLTHQLLAYTTNGGSSWDTVAIFGPLALNFDFFDNYLSMLIRVAIVRTDDAWQTWSKPFVDTIGFSGNIEFASNTTAYAVGLRVIIKSTDTGLNWEYVQPGFIADDRILGLSAIDSNTVYTISSQQLLFTDDGGVNWTDIPLPDIIRFDDVEFLNKDYGWITGAFRRIYRTTDGGITWENQTPPEDDSEAFSRISTLDSLTAAVCSNKGSIFWTNDGGKNWIEQMEHPPTPIFGLRGIQVVSKNVAYAVGDDGRIFKTTTGGVTFVDDDKNVPEEFELYQNFPNPFNPSTTISYRIAAKSFVTLMLYDILGNEIATLVNEEKPAGKHKVIFKAKGLPSGVYLYRITAGNLSANSGQGFVGTKKMILLR